MVTEPPFLNTFLPQTIKIGVHQEGWNKDVRYWPIKFEYDPLSFLLPEILSLSHMKKYSQLYKFQSCMTMNTLLNHPSQKVWNYLKVTTHILPMCLSVCLLETLLRFFSNLYIPFTLHSNNGFWEGLTLSTNTASCPWTLIQVTQA